MWATQKYYVMLSLTLVIATAASTVAPTTLRIFLVLASNVLVYYFWIYFLARVIISGRKIVSSCTTMLTHCSQSRRVWHSGLSFTKIESIKHKCYAPKNTLVYPQNTIRPALLKSGEKCKWKKLKWMNEWIYRAFLCFRRNLHRQ